MWEVSRVRRRGLHSTITLVDERNYGGNAALDWP
jgi:hypothetical protein